MKSAQLQWSSIFCLLIAGVFLEADNETHGGLCLTETARPVLKGDNQFHCVSMPVYVDMNGLSFSQNFRLDNLHRQETQRGYACSRYSFLIH